MSKSLLRPKLRRDLRQRRRQVIAVAATVFIGVSLFVVSWDMYRNLQRSYEETYEQTQFADVWAHGDDSVAAAIASIESVDTVEQRVSADISMDLGQGATIGRVQSLPIDEQPLLNQIVLLEGSYLDPETEHGVVLESNTADNFDLTVGAGIELFGLNGWVDSTVVGIAASPEWLWMAPSSEELLADPLGFGVVFTSHELAELLAPPGSNQVIASVADHDPEASAAVTAAAYTAGATDAYDRAHHPSDQALQSDVEGFRQMAVLFPMLFLGVAALATSVLLSRMIQSQRGEIGMLRAFGFGESEILRHFATYGVVTAMIGGVPAVILGAAGGWWATSAYTSFLSIPFTSRDLNPSTLVVALAISALIGLAAGYLPARAAARISPATAMRPLGDIAVGRRSWLEKLLPRRAPSWALVAVRNISRQRRRSAATMFGVVLALILIVSAFVMNDSINEIFTRQFDEIDQRDLVVVLDGEADEATLAGLTGTDGVVVAEAYMQTPVLFGSEAGFAAQQLQVYEPGSQAHEFASAFTSDGVLLGQAARDDLAVESGDVIVVTLPGFDIESTLTVAGFVDEPISGFSYLAVGTWVSLTGAPPPMAVLTLENDDTHAEVRADLSEHPAVVAVEDHVAIAEEAESLLAASRFFVGLMLVFAMVMAVALIFNAMTVTISERESEVANLQANGVGRSWIRRTITLENLLTALGGIIPGLVAGRILGAAFLAQFSTAQFRFEPGITTTSLMASVGLIVVAALVAQVPGLRSLFHLDLAAKVRERGV